MSGQYPRPNPYGNRHHTQTPVSPWAHSQPRRPQAHPSGMVWSPHMGIQARSTQLWSPKHMDSRPIYGLQMMMGPPQQEETMDLSASAQDMPKVVDPLRNGTINGETSVIATNPLREAHSLAPINCSTKSWVSKDYSINVGEPDKEAVPPLRRDSTEVDRLNPSDSCVNKQVEQKALSLISESKSDCADIDNDKREEDSAVKTDESNCLFDNSYLSVDTDESRLVVAESTEEDVFDVSSEDKDLTPSQEAENTTINLCSDKPTSSNSEESEVPANSSSDSENVVHTMSPDSETNKLPASVDLEKDLGGEMSVKQTQQQNSRPDPSVENVEILLESMFNSQDESPGNSQMSTGGVLPSSVIVSSGVKLPTASPLQSLDRSMKEEELAKTLAEDFLPEPLVKDENVINIENEDSTKDNINDQVSKNDESESSVANQPELLCTENEIKQEVDSTESVKEVIENKDNSKLPNSITKLSETKQCQDKSVESPPIIESKPSTSSNPFIEVETELEKMFAGIVEPVAEVNNDALVQATTTAVPETNVKLPSNKKATKKRKRANSRRPSDNSVFGGSSGDSMPLKKKNKRDIGSRTEKGSKGFDNFKKGKLRESLNDNSFGSKVKGPFLHIEGSKENPLSVVIVNSGSRADDEDCSEKASTRRKHTSHHRTEGHVKKSVYNASTLSLRYNSDTPDMSWVCVFCKLGPHCVGGLGGEPAGDLFGPYRVPATQPDIDLLPPGTPSDQDVALEQKRRSGGKIPKSLRACGSIDTFVHKAAKKGKKSASFVIDQPGLLHVGDSYEVWLHEQCAIWAPGLCVIGTQLVGLDDTVWTALRTTCWQCGLAGAGLGCVVHNCPTRMHYPCAKLAGWLLDQDTFVARCHTHRTRLRP